MTKYIFVTGGVVSGLGKGITAASLGRLLKARGLKVAAQKLQGVCESRQPLRAVPAYLVRQKIQACIQSRLRLRPAFVL